MATPFFGKRDIETPAMPSVTSRTVNQGSTTPGYGSGSSAGNSPATGVSASVSAAQGKFYSASAAPVAASMAEGGSKLTVGPNIKLKGVEITDCDTLVVEGLVEATMNSRVIQIAEQGAFKGSAEIDVAEIRGMFDGHLTVRQKLVIYATGKVSGTIRYGKLVVEEGGQLSGDILVGFESVKPGEAKPVAAIRPEPQAI